MRESSKRMMLVRQFALAYLSNPPNLSNLSKLSLDWYLLHRRSSVATHGIHPESILLHDDAGASAVIAECLLVLLVVFGIRVPVVLVNGSVVGLRHRVGRGIAVLVSVEWCVGAAIEIGADARGRRLQALGHGR